MKESDYNQTLLEYQEARIQGLQRELQVQKALVNELQYQLEQCQQREVSDQLNRS